MKVALAAVSCLLAPALWSAPPTDLTTDSICRDRLTARWTNAAGVVSNALEVIKVFPNAFEADYATNYTFDAISHSGSRAKILSEDDFAEKAPGFCGEKVYAAANSVGVLQIGSTDNGGCLAFAGLGSYKGLSLVCIAQSYPLASENHSMLVSWVSGGTTNQFGRVPITDEMAPYVFPLAGVSKGAQILVQSPVKNNGRVLIDSIGFVRSYTLPYSQTNVVHAAAFPARDAYCVRGLEPLTRYCWRVRGDAADDWSEYATCETTNAAPPPLTVRVR